MLYTGKGDSGTTKFFDTKSGERISKSSFIAEALGFLDELNSFVGLCKAHARNTDLFEINHVSLPQALEDIQENLFIIQAEVGGAPHAISEEKVTKTEDMIDWIEKEIPPIKSFSIPGGTELSALLDVARTISRRTERGVIRLAESGEREIGQHTKRYLNRLSSILFALARYVNVKSGVKEKNPSYK